MAIDPDIREVITTINNFTGKFDDFIKIEKEKNELLKGIKNKLSDIAAIIALSDNVGMALRYALTDDDSGVKEGTLQNIIKSKYHFYRYYNDCDNLEEDIYD